MAVNDVVDERRLRGRTLALVLLHPRATLVRPLLPHQPASSLTNSTEYIDSIDLTKLLDGMKVGEEEEEEDEEMNAD